MLNRKKTGFVGLGALGLSLVFALQAPVAWGQTATDLVCVGCVQGTDIQDGTIGPNKLIPGSINATTIANGVIGPNKLIPGSINTTTIANDAIRSNKILDGAVQSVDIRDGGVTSVDILDNTITQADIATSGVGAAEIATNAVGQSEITAGGVASSEVLDNSLTANDLATNSVGAAEIQSNAVGVSEIGPNAVGQSEIATSGVASSEVANNSLFDVDMVDEAGADFSDGNNSVTLPAGDTVIRTVSITKPTGGVVIVNASGHFAFISTGADGARCSISEGTTVDFSHLMIGNDFGSAAGSNDFMPFASTRGFQINTAGTSTFRLVCNEFEGNVRIDDGSLNAIFVPTRY